jgi:hypothetical protein
MIVTFHRLFQQDLNAALRYYDEEGGSKLGDRFFEETKAAVDRITDKAERRSPIRRVPAAAIEMPAGSETGAPGPSRDAQVNESWNRRKRR